MLTEEKLASLNYRTQTNFNSGQRQPPRRPSRESVGVLAFEDDGADSDRLIRRENSAMKRRQGSTAEQAVSGTQETYEERHRLR